jgi:hypothetical protein
MRLNNESGLSSTTNPYKRTAANLGQSIEDLLDGYTVVSPFRGNYGMGPPSAVIEETFVVEVAEVSHAVPEAISITDLCDPVCIRSMEVFRAHVSTVYDDLSDLPRI